MYIRKVAVPVPSQADFSALADVHTKASVYWEEEIRRLTGMLNFAKQQKRKSEKDLNNCKAKLQSLQTQEQKLVQEAQQKEDIELINRLSSK